MFIFDIYIIGAGPAGITAAIYASRAALKVAIIEKDCYGGKLNKTLTLDNYPGFLDKSGIDLAEYMHNQIKNISNIECLEGEIVDLYKIKEKKSKKMIWEIKDSSNNIYHAKAVLIASGTKEKTLNIPNEVEYYGNGVSYCAICDGNLYKGKDVAVIGGGNSAAEEAIYLSKIVKTVHLIHRRNEFRADQILVEELKTINNIKIYTPYIAERIEIDDTNSVSGVTVKNIENNLQLFIKSACIFFYIGLLSEIYFLKNINLKYDSFGFILVNKKMKTNIKGLFAAGDVISKHLRQIVTANNDGSIAAITIKDYINKEFKEKIINGK